MPDFPHQPEQLTADWLSETLGAAVSDFSIEQIGVGVGLLG
ncbi:MAG: phosphotransferase, partial [Actinobacteria bacterium]|nr:phosphotransferase [Actinomycetota bacterium]